MGYSLSYEEAKKRENYVAKVRELEDRFKKFGVDYLPGDRSEVYRPIVVFPEFMDNYRIYLYVRMGIMKAAKIVKAMEDEIITRKQLVDYAKKFGVNLVDRMPKGK